MVEEKRNKAAKTLARGKLSRIYVHCVNTTTMFYPSIYFVLISSTAGMKDLVRVEVSATGGSTLLDDDVSVKGRQAAWKEPPNGVEKAARRAWRGPKPMFFLTLS